MLCIIDELNNQDFFGEDQINLSEFDSETGAIK